ncbi:hypothetical protein JCM17823_03610 [Halorubrum gandharaense]
MSVPRAVLLGDAGVERAAVWSVVGFGLSYVAFDAAAVLGTPPTEWMALGAALLAALGTVAFGRVGGGALPCTLLAYGPFAGVLLRTLDPIVFAGTPLAAVEPALVALAGAVAVGLAGYLVGRLVTSLGGPDGANGSQEA